MRGRDASADPSVPGPVQERPEAGTQAPEAQPELAPVNGPAAPTPVTGPLPATPGLQRRDVLGVTVEGTDVSPSALDACEAFLVASLSMRPDIQTRLARQRVTVVIIPQASRMTDVAAFASLRGGRTFDGRLWDDVRGSGGMRHGQRWVLGVAEETLVRLPGSTYGEGTSVGLHEFAHTLHAKGLGRMEQARVTELYRARKEAGGPWTESYAAANEQEYFAQATNCFFRLNRGIGENDPAWLQSNDPALYTLLVGIYGPPPAREEATPQAGVVTDGRSAAPRGDA
ncbi:MAG: hypothetical protein RLZZ299_2579 [Pseudomonadota bacterium]